MAATFGELLRAGRRELDAAASLIPAERGPRVMAAERQLYRLVAAMARCADDLAPDRDVYVSADLAGRDNWTRAAVDARAALRSAAADLRPAVKDDPGTPADDQGHASGRLFGAAMSLAAGRDLLHTHFTTDPQGVRAHRSDWSAVVTSAAVTAALLEELGGWASRLAALAAALAHVDSDLPGPARGRLRAASRSLAATAEAVRRVHQPDSATEPGRRLLSAVPAYTVPARQELGDPEPVAYLCRGVVVSAERLRVLAHRPVALARWSPAATAAAWRSTAAAAAASGHASGLVLRSLARRAGRVGHHPGVVERLQEAAEAMQGAWPAWRAVVTAWGQMTTETTGGRSRAVAEIGDLVVRLGRLAWDDPAWTPGRTRVATLRTPEHLAPSGADINAVAAAVHHTWDALVKIGSADLVIVQAAADAGRGLSVDSGRLYVPTRSQPEEYDVPYRFGPAPASRIIALLDSYQAAIDASRAAARALDAAAVALDLPSRLLAAAREAAASQRHPIPQRKGPPAPQRRSPSSESSAVDLAGPAASSGRPTPRAGRPASAVTAARRPGPIEQAILRLGVTDQQVLLRAAEIDKAGEVLIAKATRAAAKSAPRATAPASARHPNPAGDAALLAASSFPSDPAASLAGGGTHAGPHPGPRPAQRPDVPRSRRR
jgi:hypothetical protein